MTLFSLLAVTSIWLLPQLAVCQNREKAVQLDNRIEAEHRLYAYDPAELEKTERCWIEGKPLDIMFVVDASNSVGDKWPEQVKFIKDIIDRVAIGWEKTRVAVVQFSNNPLVRFSFNTYSRKKDLLAAVGEMRTTRGNSKLGKGLWRAMQEMTAESGMRGPAVPKVLFVVSDGRYTDNPSRPDEYYPHEVTDRIREEFGFEIYAFGVGRPDWNALKKISRNPEYVVNSDNVTDIFNVFQKYMGVRICEQLPVCTPGEHKPLDLLYIVDSSGSVDDTFHTTLNFVRRSLSSIYVHPDVVRLGLINYGPFPTMDIRFNELKNNEDVLNRLNTVRPKGKTTKTRDALALAVDTFATSPTVRPLSTVPNLKRLVILMTDGKASPEQSGTGLAQHLQEEFGVDILVVALGTRGEVEYDQLVGLANNKPKNVFIAGRNLINFERTLYEYADMNCMGRDINLTPDGADSQGEDAARMWMNPISSKCTSEGIVIEIITKNPFYGQIFVIGHDEEQECTTTNSIDNFHLAESTSEELRGRKAKIVLRTGTCGMELQAKEDGSFEFDVTLGLRFHDKVFTTSDLSQKVTCSFEPKSDEERHTLTPHITAGPNGANLIVGRATFAKPDQLKCDYKITGHDRTCEQLDARVGEVLEHKWSCVDEKSGTLRWCTILESGNLRYLVHDCVARAGGDRITSEALLLLDNDGCNTDATIMETPMYSLSYTEHHETALDVFAFAFPSSSAVSFECLISVCDVEAGEQCEMEVVHPRMREITELPPKCFVLPESQDTLNRFTSPDDLPDFDRVYTKRGFQATYKVRSRTVNMLPPRDFSITDKDEFCSMLDLK